MIYIADLFSTINSSTLNFPRYKFVALSVGSKIVVGGGLSNVSLKSVEVFNINTGLWSVIAGSLSIARSYIASCVVDRYVIFGGGYNGTSASSRIDIYDSILNTFTTQSFSLARWNASAAAVIGSIGLFVGGHNGKNVSSVVDIYNRTNNRWTVYSTGIIEGRQNIAGVSNGILAFFAGGLDCNYIPSKSVDIYNGDTKLWSTSSLSSSRSHIVAVHVGSNVLFAGGKVYNLASATVDIYNYILLTWFTSSLFIPRYEFAGTSLGCKAIFAGGIDQYNNSLRSIEIYDFTNDEWAFIDYGLSYSRHSLSAITISSTLVFLGGTDGFNYYNTIDFTSFSCPKGGFAYNGTCICLSGMYNNGSSCLICKAGISLIPQLHFFRLLFLKWCFVL